MITLIRLKAVLNFFLYMIKDNESHAFTGKRNKYSEKNQAYYRNNNSIEESVFYLIWIFTITLYPLFLFMVKYQKLYNSDDKHRNNCNRWKSNYKHTYNEQKRVCAGIFGVDNYAYHNLAYYFDNQKKYGNIKYSFTVCFFGIIVFIHKKLLLYGLSDETGINLLI